MLSEYEQNLIKEKEGPVTAAYRKARKWSLVRQGSSIIQGHTNIIIYDRHMIGSWDITFNVWGQCFRFQFCQ